MEESQQKLLHIPSQESEDIQKTSITTTPESGKLKAWLQISILTFFVLSGQIVQTVLGKVYFDYGGQSKWMSSLVPFAGFPVLFPLLCFFSSNTDDKNIEEQEQVSIKQPSSLIPALVCAFLGLLLAGNSWLSSIGLQYLPASTYTLISSTQLAFNGVFSFLLNGQKITPAILNSIVLLTVSSVLIVFNGKESVSTDGKETSLPGLLIGILATVLGAAGFGLLNSLTELAFQEIFKNGSFKVVMHMTIYQCLFATLAGSVGLFASGDWKTLGKEMEEYRLGKVSYVLYLTLGIVYSQAATLGSIGLIFKVSSLFSNVILILGVPLTQLSAVVVLHDSMSGLKLVSLFLGLWGFVSYLYQQFLDGLEANSAETRSMYDQCMKPPCF